MFAVKLASCLVVSTWWKLGIACRTFSCMRRLHSFYNSFLRMMAPFMHHLTLQSLFLSSILACHKQARVFISFLILLLFVVGLKLLYALFKCFLHMELFWWQFLVLKKYFFRLFFTFGNAISETSYHLVAFIYLNLNESLDLIYNITRCKQVS